MNAPRDALDNLLDYRANDDDVFRDFQPNLDAPTITELPQRKATDLVGIDEEIKVTKKRQPIAKLDEARLLSQAGIPKLRRITKQRLKFKGKGHEFSDVARLLNLYQLWLDDLYPRAKFADGLAIIEKLGHSRRMQIMRREWIEEGKPREQMEDPIQDTQDLRQDGQVHSRTTAPALENLLDPKRADNEAHQRRQQGGKSREAEPLFITDAEDEDEAMQPPEDELDALLAENEATGDLEQLIPRSSPVNQDHVAKPSADDEFADEMEAMAEMGGMW